VTLEGRRMSVMVEASSTCSFVQSSQNTMAFESRWRLSWTR
jgi:hypothetical protein